MTNEELIKVLRINDPTCSEHYIQNEAADVIEGLIQQYYSAYSSGYGDCEKEQSLTAVYKQNEFLTKQYLKASEKLAEMAAELHEERSKRVMAEGLAGLTSTQVDGHAALLEVTRRITERKLTAEAEVTELKTELANLLANFKTNATILSETEKQLEEAIVFVKRVQRYGDYTSSHQATGYLRSYGYE